MMKMDRGNILKQLQKLQDDMKKTQEELANEVIEGSAGGGKVIVKCNGNQEILEIKIAKEVVDPEDVELLEDLVLAAVRDALEKSKGLAEEKMSDFTKKFGIPGLL
ncbi:YbaB/EbfC family nucleoid-associated protein [bacterium]|nr:YbaB/EbfC family nucleoid-associated protein [bacterium]